MKIKFQVSGVKNIEPIFLLMVPHPCPPPSRGRVRVGGHESLIRKRPKPEDAFDAVPDFCQAMGFENQEGND